MTLSNVTSSSYLSRILAFLDRNQAAIALYTGGVVQVYLLLLAIDGMYGYRIEISLASPYVRGGALFIIAVLLFRKLATQAVKWDSLLLALLAFTIIPSLVGLMSGNLGYIFGRQLFAALTMVACYWLGLHLDNISSFEKGFRFIAYATAVGCLAFILVAGFNGFIGRAYTSLTASIPMLFALDFALLRSNILLLILCLIIVLITNLRMGVMGASIIVGTYLSFRLISKGSRKLIAAPFFAIVIFGLSMSAIFVTNKIGTSVAGISIGERANRTFEAIVEVLPKPIEPSGSPAEPSGSPAEPSGSPAAQDKVPIEEVIENVGTNRYSQSIAVFNAVSQNPINLLLGLGFGAEYKWDYYSSFLQAWQHYQLDQTDMMVPYFLLMGGLLFATIIPLLILWQSIRVYLNLLPTIRLGALFVLGFGSTMFFGFQPNVPLYWLLLGALSQPRMLKPT